MEYEQLENGKRVIVQTIMQQDVGRYYELLAPDVVLTTHFPYPGSHRSVANSILTSTVAMLQRDDESQRQLRRQLLRAQANELQQQHAVYKSKHAASREQADAVAAAGAADVSDGAVVAATADEVGVGKQQQQQQQQDKMATRANAAVAGDDGRRGSHHAAIVTATTTAAAAPHGSVAGRRHDTHALGRSASLAARRDGAPRRSRSSNYSHGNSNSSSSSVAAATREPPELRYFLQLSRYREEASSTSTTAAAAAATATGTGAGTSAVAAAAITQQRPGSQRTAALRGGGGDAAADARAVDKLTGRCGNGTVEGAGGVVIAAATTMSRDHSNKARTSKQPAAQSGSHAERRKARLGARGAAGGGAVTGDASGDDESGGAADKVTAVNDGDNNDRAGDDDEDDVLHGEYASRVDVVRGRRLAAARLCCILDWLKHEVPYLATVRVQLEARKGILHDGEVLPPPPTPHTARERYALLGRQYTARNQRLSRLLVTWGSEDLLFRDECYFDDGVVVSIQRHMLPLEDVLHRGAQLQRQQLPLQQRIERVRRSVLGFYGLCSTTTSTTTTAASATTTATATATTATTAQHDHGTRTAGNVAVANAATAVSSSNAGGTTYYHARLGALREPWPLLDYSFIALDDPLTLLRVQPVSGKPHMPRGTRPAVDPRIAQGVFLNMDNDPSRARDSMRVLVKARNKKGEEEVYEFDRDRKRYSFYADDNAGKAANAVQRALDAVTERYEASAVRISSCGLAQHVDRLVPVLRGLVANACLLLQSLDLSDNALTSLPDDLALLPLQKLQLHGNRLHAWRDVEVRLCALPFLSSLTLHGNPLSEHDASYWPRVLALLLSSPHRRVALRSLDFVTLTAQDHHRAMAYVTHSSSSSSSGSSGGGNSTDGARRQLQHYLTRYTRSNAKHDVAV